MSWVEVCRARATGASVLMLCTLAGQAMGQADREAVWNPPTSGNWSDAEQWFIDGEDGTGIVPNNLTGDTTWDARINFGAESPYTVTLDINVGLTGFELTDAVATLDLTSNALTVDGAADVRFGTITGSGGSLTVGSGSQFGATLLTGVNLNVAGSTSVTGGSMLENSLVNNSAGMSFNLATTTTTGDDSGDDGIDICDTCVDSQGVGSTVNWFGSGNLNLEQGGEIMNGEGSTFNVAAAPGALLGSTDGSGIVNNQGTMIRADPSRGSTGGVRLENITFLNSGLVRVVNSSLQIDSLNQLDDGILRGGTYEVMNAGELSMINSQQEQFQVLGLEADVRLMGENSRFEELKALREIGTEGRLRIEQGRNFATTGIFTVRGELSVGQGSLFDVAPGGLTNIFFDSQAEAVVLRGGTYVIEGTLDAGIEDPQIDVIDADVTLIGTQSLFDRVDTARRIGSQGRLAIEDGRNFSRNTAFTVADGGQLRVGNGSTFTAEVLTNFTTQQGFVNAFFDIAGTLRASNAQVQVINNFLILDGVDSRIVNFQGADALETLERIGATGTLVLRNGRTLDNIEDLIVDGTLIIEPGLAGLVPGRAEPEASQVRSQNIIFTDDATLSLLISSEEPGSFGAVFADRLMSIGESDGSGGLLEIRFGRGYDVQVGDTFELARAVAGMQGKFADLSVRGLGDGLSLDVIYTGNTIVATVVPTPATLAMLGLTGITAMGRRRRR